MKEARIVCLVNQYRIKDLRLDLVKGQEVFLTEKQAVGSVDLRAAKLAGAVSFQWTERSKEVRPPPQSPSSEIRRIPQPLPTESPQVDPRLIQEMVERSVQAQMAGLQKALVGEIREALGQISVTAVQPVAPARGRVVTDSGPEEPVFIPGTILGDSAKAEIHVEAETAEEDLSEAHEALRALRKKRTDDEESDHGGE